EADEDAIDLVVLLVALLDLVARDRAADRTDAGHHRLAGARAELVADDAADDRADDRPGPRGTRGHRDDLDARHPARLALHRRGRDRRCGDVAAWGGRLRRGEPGEGPRA